MSWSYLEAEAEELVRLACPLDFNNRPLYVVSEEGRGNALGFTFVGLDLVFRKHLKRRGRWNGRGPCLCVNRADLPSLVAPRCRFLNRYGVQRMLKKAFLGVVAHEVAHIVDAFNNWPVTEESGTPLNVLAGVAREHIHDDKPLSMMPVPFIAHEWRFIRACLHLDYRLDRLVNGGVDPAVDTLTYGLESGIDRYRDAIGSEPEQCDGYSLSEILATPPPTTFAKLWRHDVVAWLSQTKAAGHAVQSCGDRLWPPT